MLSTIADASANAVQILAVIAAGLFAIIGLAEATARSWGHVLAFGGATLVCLAVMFLA